MPHRLSYNPSFGELGLEVAKRWPEWRVLKERGKTKDTLGLALSGGGYRSAIYCYGVLRGLHQIGVLPLVDYLSVVSGGSWIGMAYATTKFLEKWFFDRPQAKPNFVEEGFESFLGNPVRLAQELALARATPNYVSDVYGRLIAGTFLREHGQDARFRPLADAKLIKDKDRPFLIVNGTLNYRPTGKFEVIQECFEMTRLYCGSRSLGYISTADVRTPEPIRVRDAVAVSGAALAVHFPGLGDEVHGVGLSREIANYTPPDLRDRPTDDQLDLADGGFYNNLGVESLVNRGCGYLIVVDAEHDPECIDDQGRSNQKYAGLRTLMKRNHIETALGHDAELEIARIDVPDEPVHLFKSKDSKIPDILYIKLKSWKKFDTEARKEPYNKPGFLRHLLGRGEFAFDPQFSTAKLDYEFNEHRNLSGLGTFVVEQYQKEILAFARNAR